MDLSNEIAGVSGKHEKAGELSQVGSEVKVTGMGAADRRAAASQMR